MVQYVEAPQYVAPQYPVNVFFAGSIMGTHDWQKDLLDKVKGLNMIIYNPRRTNFPIHDPSVSRGHSMTNKPLDYWSRSGISLPAGCPDTDGSNTAGSDNSQQSRLGGKNQISV